MVMQGHSECIDVERYSLVMIGPSCDWPSVQCKPQWLPEWMYILAKGKTLPCERGIGSC